jgi:hypothetical protein
MDGLGVIGVVASVNDIGFIDGSVFRPTYRNPAYVQEIRLGVKDCFPFGTLGDRDFRNRLRRVGLPSGKHGSRKHFARAEGKRSRLVLSIAVWRTTLDIDDDVLQPAKARRSVPLCSVLKKQSETLRLRHFPRSHMQT